MDFCPLCNRKIVGKAYKVGDTNEGEVIYHKGWEICEECVKFHNLHIVTKEEAAKKKVEDEAMRKRRHAEILAKHRAMLEKEAAVQ